MKVLQIVPGVDEHGAGPSISVPMLCHSLKKYADVELILLEQIHSVLANIKCKAFPVKSFPSRILGRSPAMFDYIQSQAQELDIICTNSLWMMPNIYQEKARRGSRAKSVVMPRGTLSSAALRYSRWKKFLVWHFLGQKQTLRNADMFVATCEEEYRDIRTCGFRQPVAIIPNGVDIPKVRADIASQSERTLLFLSRIHKHKGVELLLRSWRNIMDQYPAWKLKIVGSLETHYARSMVELSRSLGCQRVTFPGELLGEKKAKAFQEASCFILPTCGENFGIAIAEALSFGVPVITTQGAPWSGLGAHQAGWWVKQSDIESAMHEALSMSGTQLAAYGMRGAEWMKEDFSWEEVAIKTMEAYEYILRPANGTPDCVRVD